MSQLQLIDTTVAHINHVTEHCRGEEFLEAEALGAPLGVLLAFSWTGSDECLTAVNAAGVPVAIFGVSPNGNGTGTPWLVATPEVYAHRRELMVLPRPYLERWLARYTCLSNFCLTTNTRSIRWLEALGFSTRDLPGGWTQFTME